MATKALFNTVVNWFIRQRIDQIQNFMNHPIETQKGILFSQLFHAEDTEYGRKYGFNSISSYQDFKNKVPVVTYEEMEPYIEKARQGQKDVSVLGYIKHFAKIFGNHECQKQIHPDFCGKP